MLEQNYRRELEEKAGAGECKDAFERLKRKYSVFNRYPDVKSIHMLFDKKNKAYVSKDKVMIILLIELYKSNAIYPLIEYIFFDSLYRFYRSQRTKVDDESELAAEIKWAFYRSLINFNMKGNRRKVDVNIYLTTVRTVINWEKKIIREKEAIRGLKDDCKSGMLTRDLQEIVTTIKPEEMEAYLLDLVYRKIIDEKLYDLILETLIYKRMTQAEWGKENGYSAVAVRTIKFRAEKAIRRHMEQNGE